MTKLLPSVAVKAAGVAFAEDDIRTIKEAVLPRNTTETELQLFLAQSKRTGLDPLSRQIYGFKQGDKLVIGTTIDGARVIAERSGKYAGQVGPFWTAGDTFTDEHGVAHVVWQDIWLKKEPPVGAKVGIIRSDFKEILWGVARFESYRPTYNSPVWSKMPDHMLGKVAEMLALRKAFPNDLSGLYAKEEFANEEVEVVQGKTHLLSEVREPEEEREVQTRVDHGDKTSHRRQRATIITAEPATTPGSVVASSLDAPGHVEAVHEVKASVGSRVETVKAESQSTVEIISTPATEQAVTPEDLMQLLSVGIRSGFTEDEISDHIEKAYGITGENALELTRAQLIQAKVYFQERVK